MADRQDDSSTPEALSRLTALGYATLANLDPEAAAKALRSAQAMTSRLPALDDPALEPAMVFIPDEGAKPR